ncbi:MAG: ATP-binding protein [bacterium]
MRLLWRVYICFLLCIVLALAVMGWYVDRSLQQFHQERIADELLIRARVFANELAPVLSEWKEADIDKRCKEVGRLTQSRATVILPDGKVIGDSNESPSRMENHSDRPEVAQALAGQPGRSVRFSDTIRRNLMYLAVPVKRGDVVVAVVRCSVPLSVIDEALSKVYQHIAYGGIAMAALSALLAFYLSRRISRPLEMLQRVTMRLAEGDLDARVTLTEGGETGSFARALNQMAALLKERVDTLARRSNEQKAVLSSMAEGVLAIDTNERIIDLNQSAALLLDLVPGQARGRSIQEAVRNLDLQTFIKTTLLTTDPNEADIVVHGNIERSLQLHGTALTDAVGVKLGILVVLNDVTRLKRLETIRREFVANVSHELKTPITTLKGCVDTMSDNAALSKEDADRFLGMMRRHVERLDASVEGLLTLSRIEHDTEHATLPTEVGLICDVLREAVQAFARAAEEKNMVVELQCPGDLAVPLNAKLLDHAVGNLIDNAIKYSGSGTRVIVSAAVAGDWVEIRVADHGPGIEKKHLERIFERFYRVDSARSRGLGGTGLGLAIAKHATMAHRGSISVESTSDKGSVFKIRIPILIPGR